ncbi:concanavalin A-like lectin/glucanase domain-containing protein [Lipomyces kononenkoae]
MTSNPVSKELHDVHNHSNPMQNNADPISSHSGTAAPNISTTPPRRTSMPVTPSSELASRPLSLISMQRKPSVFYYRQSRASLPGQSPSQSEKDDISGGNIQQSGRIRRRHFVSRRIPFGYSGDKPWRTNRSIAERLLKWIMVLSFVMGLAIVGVLTWIGTTEMQNYNYCTVLEDNFDEGFLNTTIGGFGNGEFEWATTSSNNSFVSDGKLYIVPTFTADVIGEDNMMNGYTVNLTEAGTCTSTVDSDCAIVLLTSNFANIRYGKIEVTAKLPQGDWLWPAIWMMPKDSVYGVWPASGEIDICESRGNDHTYPLGGVNVMSSTLHWGPVTGLDMYWKTTGGFRLTHSTFADGFHTFGLEWNQHYIMTYLDGRLRQVIYHKFGTPFWQYGNFPSTYQNGSTLSDPWPSTDSQAPFDQEFYLILDLAVGGTNGWFPDNEASKPWSNGDRQTAMNSFWNARDQWQPTWGDEYSRGLVIDSVKIYSLC